jgi:hypothetical protein
MGAFAYSRIPNKLACWAGMKRPRQARFGRLIHTENAMRLVSEVGICLTQVIPMGGMEEYPRNL